MRFPGECGEETAYCQALGNSNTCNTTEDEEKNDHPYEHRAWQKAGTQCIFITNVEMKRYFSLC